MKDYKKILEGVVDIINNTEKSDIGFANICIYIGENCPELAESEDEKIRKDLIVYLRSILSNKKYGDKFIEGWIAWLEKQGEHANFRNKIQIGDKVTRNEDGVLVNLSQLKRVAKPADKVEPKFHVNDWVMTDKNDVVQIKAVNNGYYTIDNGMDFNMPYVDRYWHKWTIQDTKDGDVLYMDNGAGNCIFIYKSSNNGIVNKYASYNKFGFEGEHYLVLNDGYVIPATKEQRDQLEKAMTDAGYTFDFVKKELKEIKNPTAWSEEDDNCLSTIIAEFSKCAGKSVSKDEWMRCNDWLNSLRDRVQPKQEWSALDERNLQGIIDEIEANKNQAPDYDLETYDRFLNWLKSIRPQSQWKPSDEQMEALEHFVRSIGESGYTSPYDNNTKLLYSLLSDLKKLKG